MQRRLMQSVRGGSFRKHRERRLAEASETNILKIRINNWKTPPQQMRMRNINAVASPQITSSHPADHPDALD